MDLQSRIRIFFFFLLLGENGTAFLENNEKRPKDVLQIRAYKFYKKKKQTKGAYKLAQNWSLGQNNL